MTDIIDQANQLEELHRARSLAAVPRPTIQRSQTCRNCDEPLVERFNFCDADCREDYERRNHSRRRNLHVEDDD